MSYILEALKKAEAQRGRGDVPGLDAQHMPPEPLSAPTAGGGHSLLIGIIMVLGVAVIGLLLWSGKDTSDAPAQASAPVPITPAPVAQSAQSPLPTPMVPPVATAPLVPPPDIHDLPRHFQQPPEPRATAEARMGKGAAVTPSPPANTPLPESMWAQFPKLNFGGAMHSDNAASRMLIVNGQLFHEGDTVAPGVVLQRIELKSATFRFKGHSHTVQY